MLGIKSGKVDIMPLYTKGKPNLKLERELDIKVD